MATVFEINQAIQKTLKERCLNSVTAVEAAAFLDEQGVLKDSPTRPGLPLRNLLRDGKIAGSRQENKRWWFIDRID